MKTKFTPEQVEMLEQIAGGGCYGMFCHKCLVTKVCFVNRGRGFSTHDLPESIRNEADRLLAEQGESEMPIVKFGHYKDNEGNICVVMDIDNEGYVRIATTKRMTAGITPKAFRKAYQTYLNTQPPTATPDIHEETVRLLNLYFKSTTYQLILDNAKWYYQTDYREYRIDTRIHFLRYNQDEADALIHKATVDKLKSKYPKYEWFYLDEKDVYLRRENLVGAGNWKQKRFTQSEADALIKAAEEKPETIEEKTVRELNENKCQRSDTWTTGSIEIQDYLHNFGEPGYTHGGTIIYSQQEADRLIAEAEGKRDDCQIIGHPDNVRDSNKAIDFVLDYTSASKWEQIAYLKWEAAEMIDVMRMFLQKETKQLQAELDTAIQTLERQHNATQPLILRWQRMTGNAGIPDFTKLMQWANQGVHANKQRKRRILAKQLEINELKSKLTQIQSITAEQSANKEEEMPNQRIDKIVTRLDANGERQIRPFERERLQNAIKASVLHVGGTNMAHVEELTTDAIHWLHVIVPAGDTATVEECQKAIWKTLVKHKHDEVSWAFCEWATGHSVIRLIQDLILRNIIGVQSGDIVIKAIDDALEHGNL
jgi:hypothetical protein